MSEEVGDGRYAARLGVPSELLEAWGEWLDGWSWEWWATLTFRDRGDGMMVGPRYANVRWKVWVKALQEEVGHRVHFARFMEYQKWRGVPHYHALMMGVGDARRLSWMDKWDELAGYARIYPYNPGLGARFYVTKYVAKEDGEWVLSPGLDRVRSVLPLDVELAQVGVAGGQGEGQGVDKERLLVGQGVLAEEGANRVAETVRA